MIAFDVDGVLADSIHGFDRWAARRFGVATASLGPFDDYENPESRWPEPHRLELERLYHEVYHDGAHGVYDASEPVDGALDAVTRLQRAGLAAGYVTRRRSALGVLTRAWLTRHGFPDLPLRHADGATPKAPLVRSIGATVMVEDSPTEALAIAADGVHVLLRHEPYNASVAAANVTRCRDWGEIEACAREALRRAAAHPGRIGSAAR